MSGLTSNLLNRWFTRLSPQTLYGQVKTVQNDSRKRRKIQNAVAVQTKSYSIWPVTVCRVVFHAFFTPTPNGYSISFPTIRLKLYTAAAGFSKFRPIVKSFARSPITIDKFGDDAYFMFNGINKDYIGVADGVGGWRLRGYDPSAFSTSLMRICRDVASKKGEEPIKCIDESYKKLLTLNTRKDQNLSIIGSSTVCVLSLDHQSGKLLAANLGDSGFFVVRNHEILIRSEKQTHDFNTPKQLAYGPPSMKYVADMPTDAENLEFKCQRGDIIVTATDGLFDNVPEYIILAELGKLSVPEEVSRRDLEVSAKELATLAKFYGEDKYFDSPFAKSAKAAGFRYMGGKLDDVTVIVSMVNDLGTEV